MPLLVRGGRGLGSAALNDTLSAAWNLEWTMANATDLLSSVYDLLAKSLGISASPDQCLQLSWPGIALSAADFKRQDNPNGGYDAAVAQETFSVLANIAPTCNALKFENSGFEIDDLYQILISGAMIQSSDPGSPGVNPAYKLFSDAQYELTQAQRGNTQDPSLFYYPSKATPTDWYTESSALGWSTISVSSSQVTPPNPDSSFIRFGGKELVEKGLMRMIPASRDLPQIKQLLQSQLGARIRRFETMKPAPALLTPRSLSTASSLRASDTSSRVVPRKPLASARSSIELSATPLKKSAARPMLLASKLGSIDHLSIEPKTYELLPPKAMRLNEKLLLRGLLIEQLASVPVSSTTQGFSISFKYCLVNITRSWLKSALINTKNWYMFGTTAGEYSQGRLDNNPGMFPLLTSSFVAIRDLKISANWSPQDLHNAVAAKSFGPFDISAGSINQNTIEAKGLQIIAWQSRLMPVLPPLSPPIA